MKNCTFLTIWKKHECKQLLKVHKYFYRYFTIDDISCVIKIKY